MTPNPILKVLFTFQKYGVESLLIGGQACIIYGAAEFSRDSDFVILSETGNLAKLRKALRTLEAMNIYVPSLREEFLDKGHACHFRCSAKSVKNLRIDIIAKLRGCDDFKEMWKRKFTVKLSGGKKIEVIAIEDLVQSKKTQRDKDWLMLKRLVENDLILTRNPSIEKIKWWLYECRNVAGLVELVKKNKNLAEECAKKRPLLKAALKGNIKALEKSLGKEELLEREKDREYWRPLRKELEILRRGAKRRLL